MRKHYVSLFTIAAISIFTLASCSGKKAKDAAQEEAASQAGLVSQNVLKEELKLETIQLLKDMPDSDIPQRIAAGEITIGIGNLDYMLPVGKASEMATASQKARALGIYLSDYSLLKVSSQPVTEIEAAMTKLASDLDVTFILNKEAAPVKTKDELNKQQETFITALAERNKMDVAVEILGGMAAENACVFANPSLFVKGDVAYAESLSENMLKRFGILGEVINDLAAYYPDLASLNTTLSPLKDKITTVNTARAAQADILAIRNKLIE
jgi:hypothetical protein